MIKFKKACFFVVCTDFFVAKGKKINSAKNDRHAKITHIKKDEYPHKN